MSHRWTASRFKTIYANLRHPLVIGGLLLSLAPSLEGCDSTDFSGAADRGTHQTDNHKEKNAGLKNDTKDADKKEKDDEDEEGKGNKSKARLSKENIEHTEWEGCCQGIGTPTVDYPFTKVTMRFKKSGDGDYEVLKMAQRAYTNSSCTSSFRHPIVDAIKWPQNMSMRLGDLAFDADGKRVQGKEQTWTKGSNRMVAVPVTMIVDQNDILAVEYQYPQGMSGKGHCRYKPLKD